MPLALVEVVAVVRRLGGGHFQPTAEVVAGRVSALVAAGLLDRVEALGEGGYVLETTEAGLARARRLLCAELDPVPGGLDVVGATLKVCFLDLLDPGARAAVIEGLVAVCARELTEARAALGRCPCRRAFTRCWLAREVERRAAELRWLRDLVPTAAAGLDPDPPRC